MLLGALIVGCFHALYCRLIIELPDLSCNRVLGDLEGFFTLLRTRAFEQAAVWLRTQFGIASAVFAAALCCGTHIGLQVWASRLCAVFFRFCWFLSRRDLHEPWPLGLVLFGITSSTRFFFFLLRHPAKAWRFGLAGLVALGLGVMVVSPRVICRRDAAASLPGRRVAVP